MADAAYDRVEGARPVEQAEVVRRRERVRKRDALLPPAHAHDAARGLHVLQNGVYEDRLLTLLLRSLNLHAPHGTAPLPHAPSVHSFGGMSRKPPPRA